MSPCTELGQMSSKFIRRIPLGHRRSCFQDTSVVFLANPNRISKSTIRFRCILDQIAPRLVISSSLNSVISSGNVIAAAAAAATGASSAHSAVTSALAHVTVTAVAIAFGACLSTKVDFLWPRVEEQPDALILDGVDVTGYPVFNDAKAGSEGYCICKESSLWPVKENRGALPHSLYPYRKNLSSFGSIKQKTNIFPL
eukprot:TRINITY_DN9321_c0_g1_i3.p1 TRINITY_DN9321_c0_g1~~TRINITY_DN9321_c0_g1_i3.p1  ORF type:complete len:198 (-),score=13.81 TRINITY_DN9321_c0_g1_i3:61-654(-)